MKILKLTILALMAGAIILMTLAEYNLQRTIERAAQMETDGEILQVLHEGGFRIGIYDEITPTEKIKALFR